MAKRICTTIIDGKEYTREELMAAMARGDFDYIMSDTGVPPKSEPKEEAPKRKPRRAVRIEADREYKEKIKNYRKEYQSISMDEVNSDANSYFQTVLDDIKSGESETEVFQNLYDYLIELIQEDVRVAKGTTESVPFGTAFAMSVAGLALDHAIRTGNQKEMEEWNSFRDVQGRRGGTGVAFIKSNDPLQALVKNVYDSYKNTKEEKVSSGRTKGEVVAEIKEETNKIKAQVVDKATESGNVKKVTAKVLKSERPKKISAPVSRRARAKKDEADAIAQIKAIWNSSGVPGPMMAATSKGGQLAAAITKLAKAEIELGAYSFGEAVAATYKKVKQYVSKRAVEDVLREEWETLGKFSDEIKKEDAINELANAISSGTGDAAIKALAKAMNMVKGDYIKAWAKKNKVSLEKAAQQILSDPAEANKLVSAAMERLRQDVEMGGKFLDLVKVKKPSDMDEDQWNSLRAKYVLNQFQKAADAILGRASNIVEENEAERLRNAWLSAKDRREAAVERKAQKETDKERQKLIDKELEEAKKEEEQALADYEKAVNKAIKNAAKKFYKEGISDFGTFAEALMNEIPFLTLPEAIELSMAVQAEMKSLAQSVDQRRIKELIKEMTDGREDSSLAQVIAKTIIARGAMTTNGFVSVLGKYLGYKGLSPSQAAYVAQAIPKISAMPPGIARQTAIKAVNNIVYQSAESVPSLIWETFSEVIYRNVLSPIKTAFSGGLSVFLLTPAAWGFNLIGSPIRTLRATAHFWKSLAKGNYAIKAAARDTFIEHNVPVSRELTDLVNTNTQESKLNPYERDRAWVRVREKTWKDIVGMWNSNPGQSIAYGVAKALINLNFQGKSSRGNVPISNFVNDFQMFLDYLNAVALRDFYASMAAQKKAVKEGYKPGAGFEEAWKSLVSADKASLDQIEKDIEAEVTAMINSGMPVPANYRSRRRRQMMDERSEPEILKTAHHRAVQSIGMGTPVTLGGNFAYMMAKNLQGIGNPKVEGQLGWFGLISKSITMPITMFSRMAIVLGEKSFEFVPLFGAMPKALALFSRAIGRPVYQFEYKEEDKLPKRRRKESGEFYDPIKEETEEFIGKAVVAASLSAALAYILSAWWDDEEVKDKDGKPVLDPDGKPIIRRKYINENIDFYGSSNEKITSNVRGVTPKDVVRVRTGVDENGMPVYEDYPFTAFPSFMYGMLKGIGEQRDKERFLDDQIKFGLADNGEIVKYVELTSDATYAGLAGSMAMNSWNLDFQSTVRLAKAFKKGDALQGVVDVFAIDPAKNLVSPNIAEDISKQWMKINEMNTIYVDWKLEDDGLDGMVDYLSKDVWFADPFIQDRKNYESIDPFGNPIEFPPVYSDFVGMFGTSVNFKMAEHEKKYKDLYNLYRDENGKYNPSVLAFPKRYTVSNAGKASVGEGEVSVVDETATFDTKTRRELADSAYEIFGQKIKEYGIKKLQDMPYKERANILEDYLWSHAKSEALMRIKNKINESK
jgi:hypothetical protein